MGVGERELVICDLKELLWSMEGYLFWVGLFDCMGCYNGYF